MAIQYQATGSPVRRPVQPVAAPFSSPAILNALVAATSNPASLSPAATAWPQPAAPEPAASPPETSAPAEAPPAAQALAGNPRPWETDPGYLAALAAQQANSQAADNALKAAREAAIVQFGDPSLATALPGFSLDPLTAAAAQQNTQAGNSTLAQLQRQRDLNQQSLQNQLAAHGIIRSGDLGYRTGQNQQNYGTELYNAQQGVLSGLSQALAQNLATKAGARDTANQALISTMNTYVSNPQFWGAVDTGGDTAAKDAAATAPVATALGTAPSPYGTRLSSPTLATSRLAKTPMANPYSYRTARNVAMG